MQLKVKRWWWVLTFPFAHANYTALRNTVYYPKRRPPTQRVLAHEAIHIMQQKEVGFLRFLFLYLFCFPFVWNPWRWQWEFEAYVHGSELSETQAATILRSYKYGWLRGSA